MANNFSAQGYGLFVILYMIVTSDIFSDNILAHINGTVDNTNVTSFGALVSCLMLIIMHITIVELLKD
jgi:hypothetical protein